jgi:hypothetical protein
MSVPPEVAVQLLGSKAIVKAVDDIVICYIGDGSTRVEEPLYERSQGFATLLFTQA